MDDVKISFRIENIGFDAISDLNEVNQEKIKQFFLLWEKKVRCCSAIHFINRELNLDSSKVIDISVETMKESLTTTG